MQLFRALLTKRPAPAMPPSALVEDRQNLIRPVSLAMPQLESAQRADRLILTMIRALGARSNNAQAPDFARDIFEQAARISPEIRKQYSFDYLSSMQPQDIHSLFGYINKHILIPLDRTLTYSFEASSRLTFTHGEILPTTWTQHPTFLGNSIWEAQVSIRGQEGNTRTDWTSDEYSFCDPASITRDSRAQYLQVSGRRVMDSRCFAHLGEMLNEAGVTDLASYQKAFCIRPTRYSRLARTESLLFARELCGQPIRGANQVCSCIARPGSGLLSKNGDGQTANSVAYGALTAEGFLCGLNRAMVEDLEDGNSTRAYATFLHEMGSLFTHFKHRKHLSTPTISLTSTEADCIAAEIMVHAMMPLNIRTENELYNSCERGAQRPVLAAHRIVTTLLGDLFLSTDEKLELLSKKKAGNG